MVMMNFSLSIITKEEDSLIALMQVHIFAVLDICGLNVF